MQEIQQEISGKENEENAIDLLDTNVDENDHKYIERLHKATDGIYSNDVIMREIIRNFQYTKRLDLELVSRRMYNLSSCTPCIIGKALRLDMSEQKNPKRKHGDKAKKSFIMILEKKITGTKSYKVLEGLNFTRTRRKLGPVLKLISKRFSRELIRIALEDKMDADFVRLLDENFKYTSEFYCTGFYQDAIDYLLSDNQGICKRIRKLGLIDLQVPENCDFLKAFTNLDQITLIFSSEKLFNIDSFLGLVKSITPLCTISIKYTRQDEATNKRLVEIAACARNLKFSDPFCFTSRLMEHLFNIQNLSHLDVTLHTFSDIEAITFFESINLYRIKCVSLSCVNYNDKLLETILSYSECDAKLADLTLRAWKRLDHGVRPLLSICPKSLKLLKLHFATLIRTDFDVLIQNSPYLEEFIFDPSVNERSLHCRLANEYLRTILSEFFIDAMEMLPFLTRFKTTTTMRDEFLSIICNVFPAKRMQKLEFHIHGINVEKTKELLKKVYNKISIFDKYAWNIDSDDESQSVKYPSHCFLIDPPVSRCAVWSVVLDDCKKDVVLTEPINFADAKFISQDCLCNY